MYAGSELLDITKYTPLEIRTDAFYDLTMGVEKGRIDKADVTSDLRPQWIAGRL